MNGLKWRFKWCGDNTNHRLNIVPFLAYIPVFPDQYDAHITSIPDHGREARILVPLAMLWPNEYFYNDDSSHPYIKDANEAISESTFAKTLKKGRLEFMSDKIMVKSKYYKIYEAYKNANKQIQIRFNNKKNDSY